jgi:hypothetical protein
LYLGFGILLAVALLAGASRAALAAEENSVETSPALRDEALVMPRGFDLVPMSQKVPEPVDYTIASLMRLASPWPIENMPAEIPAVAIEAPSASIAPVPVDKAKTKTRSRPKAKAPTLQQKPSRVTEEWWRRLFWVRVR